MDLKFGQARKIAQKQAYEASKNEKITKEYPDDIVYGITDQSLFLRIRDQSINHFDNYR